MRREKEDLNARGKMMIGGNGERSKIIWRETQENTQNGTKENEKKCNNETERRI